MHLLCVGVRLGGRRGGSLPGFPMGLPSSMGQCSFCISLRALGMSGEVLRDSRVLYLCSPSLAVALWLPKGTNGTF